VKSTAVFTHVISKTADGTLLRHKKRTLRRCKMSAQQEEKLIQEDKIIYIFGHRYRYSENLLEKSKTAGKWKESWKKNV
jgi:hypothetical protein